MSYDDSSYGCNVSGDAGRRETLEHFRRMTSPLYALLDAARDSRVLGRLMPFAKEYQSLYDGEAAAALAPYAPYLVHLPPDSPLLGLLIAEGWGRSWGVYLTCREEFSEVRRHFRRFLLVEAEDGRELYFRFYDPRVLRAFLPACTFEELRAFFGSIEKFWVEDGEEGAAVIRYGLGSSGLDIERPPLPTRLDSPVAERTG